VRLVIEAIQAISFLIDRCTEPGEPIGIHTPGYHPILDELAALGRPLHPLPWELTDDGWATDPDGIRLEIKARTRMRDEVVRALAPRDLRYLGLIGSRAKVARITEALTSDAVPAELLERVHAPIGLDIGAVTPQEIAVSILAERPPGAYWLAALCMLAGMIYGGGDTLRPFASPDAHRPDSTRLPAW